MVGAEGLDAADYVYRRLQSFCFIFVSMSMSFSSASARIAIAVVARLYLPHAHATRAALQSSGWLVRRG